MVRLRKSISLPLVPNYHPNLRTFIPSWVCWPMNKMMSYPSVLGISPSILTEVVLSASERLTDRRHIWDGGSSNPANLYGSPRPSVGQRSTIRCKSCKLYDPCPAKRNKGYKLHRGLDLWCRPFPIRKATCDQDPSKKTSQRQGHPVSRWYSFYYRRRQ
jgi:hypothetical protein